VRCEAAVLRAGVRDALALVVEPLGGMAREVLRARAGHENNTDYDDHHAAITSTGSRSCIATT